MKLSITRRNLCGFLLGSVYTLLLFGGTYFLKTHSQESRQVFLLIFCGILGGILLGARGRKWALGDKYLHPGYLGAVLLLLFGYRLPLTYGAYIYPVISSYYLYGLLAGFCLARALLPPREAPLSPK